MKKTEWKISYGFLLAAVVFSLTGLFTTSLPAFSNMQTKEKEKFVVVIDAGHGGSDPGKIGINGIRECDINLKIARYVAGYLEAEGVKVVLTRNNEDGLGNAKEGHTKVGDMKKRVAIMEETKPDLAVSIHQNSYPEEYVHGAQVFYYRHSEESKDLAEKIQNRLVLGVDPDNHRQVKENSTYYLLKKTKNPIVIVECGFLSNKEEAEKLSERDYQQRIAWEIHLGILQYLNENNR